MKINSQLYLGLESVCQQYVKNQTKIFNYTRSKSFTKYINSMREISVSTDIIATFYNNFDSVEQHQAKLICKKITIKFNLTPIF